MDEMEQALLARQGKWKKGELWFQCVSHDDTNPSAAWNPEKQCWYCFVCGIGGGYKDLAKRLNLCEAVGLHVRELFYDGNYNTQQIRRRCVERQYKKAKDEVEQMVTGFQIDAVREAERYLTATVGIDISQLGDQQLDTLLNSVCDALAVRLEEERGKYVNG